MRWVLLAIKSLATGVFAIVVSLITLLIGLQLYAKYVLHLGPNHLVGWDPISLFGQHWKIIAIAIPLLIFLAGATAGLWFFSPRLTRR